MTFSAQQSAKASASGFEGCVNLDMKVRGQRLK
jgi:hypothetical protein